MAEFPSAAPRTALRRISRFRGRQWRFDAALHVVRGLELAGPTRRFTCTALRLSFHYR